MPGATSELSRIKIGPDFNLQNRARLHAAEVAEKTARIVSDEIERQTLLDAAAHIANNRTELDAIETCLVRQQVDSYSQKRIEALKGGFVTAAAITEAGRDVDQLLELRYVAAQDFGALLFPTFQFGRNVEAPLIAVTNSFLGWETPSFETWFKWREERPSLGGLSLAAALTELPQPEYIEGLGAIRAQEATPLLSK